MEKSIVTIAGMTIPVYTLDTVIVGSGVAGLNAADSLYGLGRRDVAIVTEGLGMGTSINTGSDKQTYYKLTLAGGAPDSVKSMAETLFSGGAMNGDNALVEAALSARCFMKLVEAGVPFPHDGFGQYAGYKTDHDPRQRATSAGPLTSQFMAEALIKRVMEKGIPVFERMLAIAVLTCGEGDARRAAGVLTMDLDDPENLTLFNAENVVWATGGPAGIYASSVYPERQFGALGIALEAGARGANLTESQYGIASVKFRWNLSGSYQQVLPRYVSTDQNGGDEREFLSGRFPSNGKMLDAIFLKGYQWPFDPRKAGDYGSSLIDLLVYEEREIKGRRVFLDFTRNPMGGELDFSQLGKEAHDYLDKCGILFGTPIERLRKMNAPSIQLYRDHGIDLEREPLEIAVCAQHCNGGLAVDAWWESNLRNFFPVGEACGSLGVYRPGGSALNSTQAGSLRAAQRIATRMRNGSIPNDAFLSSVKETVCGKIALMQAFIKNMDSESNVMLLRRAAQQRMTASGAHIRDPKGVDAALRACRAQLADFQKTVRLSSADELPDAFRNYDMLLTQLAFLSAIREYVDQGGASRGSYIVSDAAGSLPAPGLPEAFRYRLDDGRLSGTACEVALDAKALRCSFGWKPVRPVPDGEPWFETVWKEYRETYGK